MAASPVEIFCSYAQEDELWLRGLEAHLTLLKRQGHAFLWYKRLLAPGTDWAQHIDRHLETASIILLLVSADFLASDYCYEREMRRAIERHEANQARVFPLLVRPCAWSDAPFAHLREVQVLPGRTRAISQWENTDEAWTTVVATLREVLGLPTHRLEEEAPNRPEAQEPAQQAGSGKFLIQNAALVQGQNIGDHQTITQHFGTQS